MDFSQLQSDFEGEKTNKHETIHMKYRSRNASCASYGKMLFIFPWCLFQFSSLVVVVGCDECITVCCVRRGIFGPAHICTSKGHSILFLRFSSQCSSLCLKPIGGFVLVLFFAECKDLTHNGVTVFCWQSIQFPCIYAYSSVISPHKCSDINTKCYFLLLFCLLSRKGRTQPNRSLWSSYGSVFCNMDLHYRSFVLHGLTLLTTVACAVCSHATIM